MRLISKLSHNTANAMAAINAASTNQGQIWRRGVEWLLPRLVASGIQPVPCAKPSRHDKSFRHSGALPITGHFPKKSLALRSENERFGNLGRLPVLQASVALGGGFDPGSRDQYQQATNMFGMTRKILVKKPDGADTLSPARRSPKLDDLE